MAQVRNRLPVYHRNVIFTSVHLLVNPKSIQKYHMIAGPEENCRATGRVAADPPTNAASNNIVTASTRALIQNSIYLKRQISVSDGLLKRLQLLQDFLPFQRLQTLQFLLLSLLLLFLPLSLLFTVQLPALILFSQRVFDSPRISFDLQ